MTVAELLDVLWRDLVATTPQAERLHWLLTQRGEILCNDHIALRSYGVPGLGIDALARPFEALGWVGRDDDRLSGSQLRARYWQHRDPELPKVLISELVVEALSPGAQAVIAALVGQLPARFGERADLPWAGRPWQLGFADYEALAAESAYAAWVAAFGFRVHRFTVDLASVSTFPDLDALAAFLIEHGFKLDDSAGAIMGSPAEGLEQAWTRADSVTVAFADTSTRIPSGSYGFARRHRLASGELFAGFVPASAEGVGSTAVRRVT